MKYIVKTSDAKSLRNTIISNVEKKKDSSGDNKELEIDFKYWSSFKKEDRSGDEDNYLLGRFTELLLVHFWKNGLVVEVG